MTGTKLKTKAQPPPENRRLGYARVSTYGQTLDAQCDGPGSLDSFRGGIS